MSNYLTISEWIWLCLLPPAEMEAVLLVLNFCGISPSPNTLLTPLSRAEVVDYFDRLEDVENTPPAP